jgi:beta-galactosidase
MKLALALMAAASLAAAQRQTISLDGEWRIADSVAAEPAPAAYPARAPVPGLANLAQPPFADVDRFDSREFIDTSIREKRLPESARVEAAGVPHQARNYFWYSRDFTLPSRRQSATLRVNKAMFGTAVWVNGKKAGEHLGCFTAGVFDITELVRWGGANEVIIRVGAHPAAIPMWAPAGTDFEKYKWTPGIYDSVSIALADNPLIESVQVGPRIAGPEIVIEAMIVNRTSKPLNAPLRFEVKGWKAAAQSLALAAGERRTVRVTLPLPGGKLWTPEEPNLYTLDTSTGGDSLAVRFGLREFRFDTPTKRAYLNGKLYFLRGSNITLHRFFEDPECKRLPWDEKWVRRLLIEVPKQMSWNSFRFCIGPVPDKWLDIADEAGLLVQDEFFIWNGRNRFPPYKTEELLTQYKEWMRDNWNHPSVAIWDASNETDAPVLRDVVIPEVRKLDLSDRPWDNGYSTPTGFNDPVEDHPYLFSALNSGREFNMTQLEGMTGAKTTNAGHPSAHATIINEYGWMWLNRDGSPTLLTEKVYEKLIGKDATPEQRFDLYAYYLAGLTEFWRAHRNFAGVLHFTSLTCSYPGVKTGDHWKNVTTLELEPHFAEWVKESFRPLGVYINFWQPQLAPGAKRTYAVMMVNDQETTRKGTLRLSFEREGKTAAVAEMPFEVPPLGAMTWQVPLDTPSTPGAYVLKAVAAAAGVAEPTVSRRRVEVR